MSLIASDLHPSLLLRCLWEKHANLNKFPNQVHRWEVVFLAELLKAYNLVYRNAILEAYNGRQSSNLEFVHKEWSPFGVDLDEKCLSVIRSDFLQMHVNDLAPLKIFVEKGANYILRLSHGRQEFSLENLAVSTRAQGFVLLVLLVLLLHLGKPLLFKIPHEFLFFFVHEIEIVLFIILFKFFDLFIVLAESFGSFSFCLFLLFLKHLGLVSDSLGYSELLVDLMGQIHVSKLVHWGIVSRNSQIQFKL